MSDELIVKACKKVWDEEYIKGIKNNENCSGFANAVAAELKMPLTATTNADSICNYLKKQSGGWTAIDISAGAAKSPGAEAARQADIGKLVLGCLRSDEHSPKRGEGHVVVIVSGELYHNLYPKCWCGSTGTAQSQGDKSVGEVWRPSDRDNVSYYGYGVVVRRPR